MQDNATEFFLKKFHEDSVRKLIYKIEFFVPSAGYQNCFDKCLLQYVILMFYFPFSYFQQCYQYLLSHITVKNVLQSFTVPLQFSFVLNHLGCMSP